MVKKQPNRKTSKKVNKSKHRKTVVSSSENNAQILAATVGGAVVGNIIMPGIGGVIIGGAIGVILGNNSKLKGIK